MDDDAMITTPDNPWNPFTHFDEWYTWDTMMGYHSCEILARLAKTSREFSDEMNERIIDEAMNKMTSELFQGIYIKVTKDSFKDGKLSTQSVINSIST